MMLCLMPTTCSVNLTAIILRNQRLISYVLLRSQMPVFSQNTCLMRERKRFGKHVPHIKQDLIYPAVLIGRLGISTKFQHLHIGTEVMDFIKSWFVEPYNKTGCRYLVVDAYNEDVPVAFYKKNGFDFMFSTEEQEKSYRGIVSDKPLKTRLMYFDLILIK